MVNDGARLAGGTLVVPSGAVVAENGNFAVGAGALVDNQAGAIWDFTGSGEVYWYDAATPLFTNEGTVTADAGTANTGLALSVNNTGTITALGGTMQLGVNNVPSSTTTDLVAGPLGSFHFSGSWTIPGNVSAQNVGFAFGTTTIGGALTASGAVNVDHNAGVTVAGTSSAGSTSVFYGANFTLNGPVAALGDVSLYNTAALNLDPATPQTLAIGTLLLTNGSTLEGTDNLVVNGLFTWTSSSVNINGTITLLGGAVVSDGATLAGGTLVAPSPITSTDGGGIIVSGGGTVDPTPPQTGTPPPPTPVYLDGGTLAGSGTLNSTLTNNGLVTPGGPGAAASVDLLGDYSQTGSGVLQVDIGSSYDVLGVNGNINLGGTLQVNALPGYTPTVKDTFVILNNEGSNPINGTFAGLPQCATFTTAAGLVFQITYHGGDGNDVAITELNTPPSNLVLTPSATSITTASGLTLGGTFVDPDDNQTHVVTVNWGDGSPVSTVNLVAGVFSFSGLTHTYTAASSGQSGGVYTVSAYVTDSPGTVSPTVSLPITVHLATTTTLAGSASPAIYGQHVTFTATVSPPSAIGIVTFSNGATVLGTASLNAGVATFNTSTLPVGTDQITATYGGDTNDSPSTSSVYNQIVNPNTRVTLSVSNTAPVVGQKVLLRAGVSVIAFGTSPAAGTVSFYEGSTLLGTAALSNGVTSLSVPFPVAGPGVVTAVYAGQSTDSASTSPGVNVTVGADTTKTVVTSSSSSPVFGQSVSLTATVTVVSPGTAAPSAGDAVEFWDGTPGTGTDLGAGTWISAGKWTLTTNSLAVGSHPIQVVYTPSTSNINDLGSTSALLAVTVKPDTTRTILQATYSSPVFGQSDTLTATVTVVSPGTAAPSAGDAVEFWDGTPGTGTDLGAGTWISAGKWTLTTNSLAVGSHPIQAVYTPSSSNALASTSALLAVTVKPDVTKTAVTFVSTPAIVGGTVNLVARISVVSPGTATPSSSDSVVFYDGNPASGGTALGFGILSTTVVGQWTLPWSFTTTGVHSIFAVYSPGSANLNGSAASANLTVGKDTTTTTLTTSGGSGSLGQPVTFTATIAVTSPGAGTPSGTVTFKDGATVLMSGVPVMNGVATLTTSSLAKGTHSITAVYSGDSNENASTSAAVSEKILLATTVSLQSSNLHAAAGTVTYSATVSDVTPDTGALTGTVSFYYMTTSGPVLIGTAGLTSGVAKLKPSATILSSGTYTIYAVYNGDSTHQTSSSSSMTQVLS